MLYLVSDICYCHITFLDTWTQGFLVIIIIASELVINSDLNAFFAATWHRGYKKIMLTSAEHENFFLLISVKMPTTVGILTFMSRNKSIIGLFEPGKELNFLIYLYL